MIKKNAGFSLVEIMVAAGLLGIIAIGVMQVTGTMTKSQKRFEASFEIQSTQNAIATTLVNEEACDRTFAGRNFGGAGPNITSIRNSSGAIVFQEGADYGDRAVRITDIAVENVNLQTQSGSREGTFDLAVTYQKTSKVNIGGSVTKRTRLSLVTDMANNFVSCFNAEGSATRNSCENIGGVFDMTSQNCTLVAYPGLGNIPPDPQGRQEAVSQSYINQLIDELDGRFIYKGSDDLSLSSNATTIGDNVNDSVRINAQLQVDGTLTVNGVSTFNENVNISSGRYIALQSDKSLKKKVKTLDDVLKKLSKLEGVSFEWINNENKDIGVIAQQLQEVYPELVVRNEETGKLMVKYPQLSAVALQGLKELKARNEKLETEMLNMKKALCEVQPSLTYCQNVKLNE